MSKSILSCELEHLNWPELESSAFQAFISDYCISSLDLTISRGYLHGLESLIVKAGPTSSIAQACKIVSLASLGKKTTSPLLLQKADILYSDLLPSFRSTISKEGDSTTIQSLMTAVLLGLYEMIIVTSTKLDTHVAHARGVSAFLMNKYSIYDIVCGVKLFQLVNPLSLKDQEESNPKDAVIPTLQPLGTFSILCLPVLNPLWATLDPIFAKTIALKRKAEKLLDDDTKAIVISDIQQLKQEAELLRTDYQTCVIKLSKEWTPGIIGSLPSNSDGSRPEAGYWPGPVLSYYDLYVACITNSYHKSRLSVLDIIVRCHQATSSLSQDAEIDPSIWGEAQKLSLDIVASIPFYLTKNVQDFVDQTLTSDATPKAMTPGPSVGGLLITHTLYIVSNLSVVDSMLKMYLKECLSWIGRNMGIGQATMLSENTFPSVVEYVRQAHVLVWAGMLI